MWMRGATKGLDMSSSLVQRYLLQSKSFHPRLTWSRGEPQRSGHLMPAATESDDLDPSQCALLVLDCQPEALRSVENSRALMFRTNSAIEMMRRLCGHVAFTRLAFEDCDYRFTPSTNKEFAALAAERRLRNGTSGAELHPGLAVTPSDIVVRKTRLGAFSTTNLDEMLTNLGVTTLILTGIHASGAVLSTVREAADRDYRLIVLADCISDTDMATKQMLMEQVFPRQARVLTSSRLERALTSHISAGHVTAAI